MANDIKGRIASIADEQTREFTPLGSRVETLDSSYRPAEVVKPSLFGKLLGIAKKAVANPLVQQAVTAAVLGKLNKVIKGK